MKVSTKQGKYFRGGKVQKSFLFGFCIFAFVLFRVFLYRTFYVINEVELTVWKTLCVFIDPHSDGATETICKLKSCQYYSYSTTGDKEELKRSRDWVEEWKKNQSKYPYITIFARVMKIEINE